MSRDLSFQPWFSYIESIGRQSSDVAFRYGTLLTCYAKTCPIALQSRGVLSVWGSGQQNQIYSLCGAQSVLRNTKNMILSILFSAWVEGPSNWSRYTYIPEGGTRPHFWPIVENILISNYIRYYYIFYYRPKVGVCTPPGMSSDTKRPRKWAN